VVQRLKDELGLGGDKGGAVVMVGDGATDLQAKPPADAFIGRYVLLWSCLCMCVICVMCICDVCPVCVIIVSYVC
jgi:hypothetical protein